ncbi:MAG TPA: 3-deoxy-D-manno-octulosonic acid transferase [Rhizomicrobium sp.]|nr:3-deoxy-D-manno-octulosonic acid transferase [Rhizomicrobium sp.]
MSSLTLTAYRLFTHALTPLVPIALRQRALRGKEDRERMRERLGHAGRARPGGQLIWIHGASVGETLAILPLIDALLEEADRSVLVTSGTVTSAKLMAERLPPRALHQFAPVDAPSVTARFLDHWRPDAALFVDSEIWPNILTGARMRSIPLALINGRISARSFAGWRRFRRSAARLFANYDVCLAQDAATAERLSALGARRVEVTGSLKADAAPLPADPTRLNALLEAIGSRPVLLAVSTHPGEDETILPAHDALRRQHSDLLTIIAPRHPERGGEIMMLAGDRATRQRSKSELPDSNTAVYVADTLGELGLFYRLAPFAFIGGSLIPHGGQNPLEPARLHCAVMTGPHTQNFTVAYDAILSAQGAGRVHSSGEIATLAGRLIDNPANARAMGDAAADAAAKLGGAVEKTRAAVEHLLAHARA